jgi:hypothetical protein
VDAFGLVQEHQICLAFCGPWLNFGRKVSLAAMKLFVAVRWGHAESPDGPDGEDTHFLIRASDHIEAGKLADHALELLPTTSTKPRRPVSRFSQRLIEIGTWFDTKNVPLVVMGPCIPDGYLYNVHDPDCPTWDRENEEDGWQDVHDT